MPNTKRNFRKRIKARWREKKGLGAIEREGGMGEKDDVCSK